MLTKKFLNQIVVLLVIVSLLTACVTQRPAQVDPVTLHLAVADSEGWPSDPYVRELIKQVDTLSHGSIVIEPIWQAAGNWGTGDPMDAHFEFGVIKLVQAGRFELGLAGSRAFDIHGITSFQALQAPFLIDNDSLAKAVATSAIASRMLDHLSSSGMIGLNLWPEDLRHPFSLIPDKQILSPEDFTGLKVRTAPSEVSYALIETLGGDPRFRDSDAQAAESGLRQGASLTGTPTATGNVTFFAKYQVLFVNGEAFEKLSETQRSILRAAALAAQQKAIAENPSELDAATAWCADGGSIVLASDAQVAAFETAAQPVFDMIQHDPLNTELIAAIRELKASTEPTPGAEACGLVAGQPNPESTPDTQVLSEGLPPNGIWQVELSAQDIAQLGVLKSTAAEMAGTYTWTFQDGNAQIEIQGPAISVSCMVNATVVEDFIRLQNVNSTTCNGDAYDDVQWWLDEEGLHFRLVDSSVGLPIELKATYEAKPWQKIANP